MCGKKTLLFKRHDYVRGVREQGLQTCSRILLLIRSGIVIDCSISEHHTDHWTSVIRDNREVPERPCHLPLHSSNIPILLGPDGLISRDSIASSCHLEFIVFEAGFHSKKIRILLIHGPATEIQSRHSLLNWAVVCIVIISLYLSSSTVDREGTGNSL